MITYELSFEILVILFLVLVNGLLSMSEIAILASRKTRLQQRESGGDEQAGVALRLANEPGDFLSTVQIGITLVGILAGAFGGATVAKELAGALADIPWVGRYAGWIAVALVVVVISYLSLVLGELVPKRLALNNPDQIASLVAKPMVWLAKIVKPLVRLLSLSTEFFLRLLRVMPSNEPPVTEEEIRVMLQQGTQAGVFAEMEQDMVQAVFRLADRRVGTLMTPRTEIVWLDLDNELEHNRRKIIESMHTLLPVAIGDLDKVVGVVQARDLLARCLSGETLDIQACLVNPLFVPENMPALKVLEKFRESGVHAALVIDEFGGLQGMITVVDLLESIVGDIPMRGEITEPEVVQREDGSWLLDGRLAVDEFKELFQISELPGEERSAFVTLGGFIMTFLGRIPSAGMGFEWAGYHFEVVDMDGFRVDKVLLVPQTTAAGIDDSNK